ncbi:MAG: hypothetical protein MZV63_09020 [Marinilabiliales bacterium]|nr:hypothetical protein [Marinilabiliales bacterium]
MSVVAEIAASRCREAPCPTIFYGHHEADILSILGNAVVVSSEIIKNNILHCEKRTGNCTKIDCLHERQLVLPCDDKET